MKTLNQLYKESGSKNSFKDWLQKGQFLFNQKKEEGRISPDMTFETWANAINQFEMSADAKKTKKKIDFKKIGNVAKEAGKAGIKIAAGVMAAKEAAKASTETQTAPAESQTVVKSEPKPKKTILGLKPPVFYAVAGVTVLAVGYGVYRIIKSRKS